MGSRQTDTETGYFKPWTCRKTLSVKPQINGQKNKTRIGRCERTTRHSLTRTTSRTEVTFPCCTTTWCTSQFATPSHKHGLYCFGFGSCPVHPLALGWRTTPGVIFDIREGQLSWTWAGGRCQNRPFFRGGGFRSKSRQNREPRPHLDPGFFPPVRSSRRGAAAGPSGRQYSRHRHIRQGRVMPSAWDAIRRLRQRHRGGRSLPSFGVQNSREAIRPAGGRCHSPDSVRWV